MFDLYRHPIEIELFVEVFGGDFKNLVFFAFLVGRDHVGSSTVEFSVNAVYGLSDHEIILGGIWTNFTVADGWTELYFYFVGVQEVVAEDAAIACLELMTL